MMKIITVTDRLILREFSSKDATHFYLLNLNTNVIKYTGDIAFSNVEEAKIFLDNYREYSLYHMGRWAVIEKSTNNFLGWCGLKFNSKTKYADIGFRFFEEYWNRGFATESSKACIKYGFEKLNLNTIIGRAMQQNTASIRVLEKIGLCFEKEIEFDACNKGVVYKIEKEISQ